MAEDSDAIAFSFLKAWMYMKKFDDSHGDLLYKIIGGVALIETEITVFKELLGNIISSYSLVAPLQDDIDKAYSAFYPVDNDNGAGG